MTLHNHKYQTIYTI